MAPSFTERFVAAFPVERSCRSRASVGCFGVTFLLSGIAHCARDRRHFSRGYRSRQNSPTPRGRLFFGCAIHSRRCLKETLVSEPAQVRFDPPSGLVAPGGLRGSAVWRPLGPVTPPLVRVPSRASRSDSSILAPSRKHSRAAAGMVTPVVRLASPSPHRNR